MMTKVSSKSYQDFVEINCLNYSIFRKKYQENIDYRIQRVRTTPTQATPQQYPPSPNSPKLPVQSTAQYIADHPHGLDR